jgi:hypothetical protein
MPAYIAQAPPTVSLAGSSGKRMYRTSDGRILELPPEVSIEEATRVDSEIVAVEQKR